MKGEWEMIRTRDYLIPILLCILIQFLVVFLAFTLGTLGKDLLSIIVEFILRSLLISCCFLCYLYKKQMLDWFVGVIVVINGIVICLYIPAGLVLYAE